MKQQLNVTIESSNTTSGLHLLCDVLIQASTDPELEANTNVPPLATRQEVTDWLNTKGWEIWVVMKGDLPVGYVGLHQPDLQSEAEKFSEHLEIDYYILPSW